MMVKKRSHQITSIGVILAPRWGADFLGNIILGSRGAHPQAMLSIPVGDADRISVVDNNRMMNVSQQFQLHPTPPATIPLFTFRAFCAHGG